MFEKADTDRDGFVSGAEIKGIFLKSGLAQPVLARIWYDSMPILIGNIILLCNFTYLFTYLFILLPPPRR